MPDFMDIQDKVLTFWREADHFGSKEITEMKENCKFYCGDQWDDAVRSAIIEQRKVPLTYNRVRPVVDLLSGYERRYRQMPHVISRSGTNPASAKLLNELLLHAIDSSNGDYEVSEFFSMGVRANKAFLGLEIDHNADDPANGNLRIVNYSPLRVIEDPGCSSYDLNDPKDGARYVFVLKWLDEDEFAERYPEFSNISSNNSADYRSLDGGSSSEDEFETIGRTRLRSRQVRIKECYWKQYRERWYLCDNKGRSAEIEEKDLKSARRLTSMVRGMKLRKIRTPELYVTTLYGDHVLEHEADPFNGISEFPLVRFSPYFLDGHSFGVISDLKDPQREINKRLTQALHHINHSMSSGLMVPVGSVNDPDHWKNNSSKPGFYGEYNPEVGKPEPIRPAPLPSSYMQMADYADSAIDKVSGINGELQGMHTNATSGKAIELRRDQGLMIGEVIFDNFRYSMHVFYSLMLAFICHEDSPYSEYEISNILAQNSDIQLDLSMLNNWREGKYRVKLHESASHPTEKRREFLEMLEILQQTGIQLPPELIIEQSDLTIKDKILDYFRQLKQAQQMQAQQQQFNNPQAQPAFM